VKQMGAGARGYAVALDVDVVEVQCLNRNATCLSLACPLPYGCGS
jgi:hypothetical protein